MMNRGRPHAMRPLATGCLLIAGAIASSTAHANCQMANLATYHIGQTTFVDVHNGVAEGEVVRTGSADGEGKVLLVCEAGDAHFRGRWQNGQTTTDPVPLTVRGRPSGFGIRLTLQENGGGPIRTFPHDFTQTFRQGETVTSNDDVVGYEIVRLSGPVEFGNVDPGAIAQANVEQPDGELVVFRSMEIFTMIFRRPACSISAETLNQTVKLGDYNPSNFATADRATPWVDFRLRVEECLEPVGMIAKFTFGMPSDADADLPEVFSMAGSGSKNVGLELGDEDHRTMEPGKPIQLNALGTGKDFVFAARLRETRPSVEGGGAFVRPVRVQVDFN